MMDAVFHDGGALLSDSPVYIERDADAEARLHLRRMDYLSVVEPRQQGKTSLINRLHGHFRSKGYVFAFVDLTIPDKTDEVRWYRSLTALLHDQLVASLPVPGFGQVTNANGWHDLLRSCAEAAMNARCRLVIALDEVGAAPAAWATGFFAAIRSVYNSREPTECYRHLTFITAGVYMPRGLIRDGSISDFNVDHRVRLADFDEQQVMALASHLPVGIAPEAAHRLYEWTCGQPFVTQRLLLYLSEEPDTVRVGAVDRAVERFFADDTNHLPRLLAALRDDPQLLSYAITMVETGIEFCPSLDERHFKLAYVIGLVSADEQRRCKIRNPIYARVLACSAPSSPPCQPSTDGFHLHRQPRPAHQSFSILILCSSRGAIPCVGPQAPRWRSAAGLPCRSEAVRGPFR